MYKLDEVCIGFNGGKDCTAILHLYVAFIKQFFPDNTKKITGLYLKNANPFPEAQDFIKNCELNYNLDMIVIPASIKEGLENLKETNPNIKAVIMGTRRHDPYSSQLKSFTMTDVSWPSYMRVFPILDWSYAEVWEFLRTFNLPYCKLYDDGYTSLGDPKNTQKNKSLLLDDGRYSPAYLLQEEALEREGRNKWKKKTLYDELSNNTNDVWVIQKVLSERVFKIGDMSVVYLNGRKFGGFDEIKKINGKYKCN